MRAQQVSTIEQLYQYMTQRILVLHDPPGDQEMVALFINALKDEKVRIEVARKKPTTFDVAYKTALKACFDQSHQIVAFHHAF
jgi:hypothetical protein